MALTSDSEFEYPLCPVCSSDDRSTEFTFEKPYTVVVCGQCRMYYLFPRLTELAMLQFYEQDSYFQGGLSGYSDTGYSDQENALRSTFRRLMKRLAERKYTGGDLLEIGCGYGYLLEEARPYFDRRVGTEFSGEGVRLSEPKADAVFAGGIEAVPQEMKFDCIIATQVIEHVYRPLDFILQIRAHAKPGATVVLSTPDMGGMLRKVMGSRWPSFKRPEHVNYFDFRTLSGVMRDAGLVGLTNIPHPHAFPLALIASKFGARVPGVLGKTNIWVPATTVAIAGSVKDEGQS